MSRPQGISIEGQGPWQQDENGDSVRVIEVRGVQYLQYQHDPKKVKPYYQTPRSVPGPREDSSAGLYNNVNYAAVRGAARPASNDTRASQPEIVPYSLFPRSQATESAYGIPSTGHASHTQLTTNSTGMRNRSRDRTSSYPGNSRHAPDAVIEPGVTKKSGSAAAPVFAKDSRTHSGPPSQNTSCLTEIGQRFTSIPFADYEASQQFILKNPEILDENLSNFQLEALKLLGDGKPSQARICIQRLLLLREVSKMTRDDSLGFFSRMTSKERDNDTLKAFLENLDTTFKAIKEKAATSVVGIVAPTASTASRPASETMNRTQNALSSSGRDASYQSPRPGADRDLSAAVEGLNISAPYRQDQSLMLGQDIVNRSRPPAVRHTSNLGMQPQGLTTVNENGRHSQPTETQSPLRPGAPSIAPDIQGDGERQETLDERYYVRSDAQKFFVLGRVFAMLWHESAGAPPKGPQLSNKEHFRPYRTGRYREPIHSHILRMVVVRERHGYCWCIPINTYSGRGLLKPGFHNEDWKSHAIIYMDNTRPWASVEEESLMSKKPIAVRAASVDQKLNKMSRLNFGRPSSVQWNVKVMNVGKITQDSMPRFESYWRNEVSDT